MDDTPRGSLVDRIRPFVPVFLLVVLPIALFHAFTEYMYVCRIPAGTTVVSRYGLLPPRSRLGEYCYSSGLTLKYPWLKPYLDYRHYIIPEGAVEIGEQAFADGDVRDDLRSVRIPGSVKKIDRYEFNWCGKLTDIAIPGSVESIGHSAFRECRALRAVVIPGSVKTIDGDLFEDCTGMRKAVILNGVKVIGSGAFRHCTALRTVVIPDSVEFIMIAAFQDCAALEEIRLPAGMVRQQTGEEKERLASAPSGADATGPVPNVCPLAFAGCTGLKKVTLPEGITAIGAKAFQDCTNLSEINLPDSVTEIDGEAFLGCRSLPPLTIPRDLHIILGGAFTGTGCRLTVPDDHPCFRFEDGILYTKDKPRSVISCVSPPDGPCAVDPDTTSIWSYAFFGCEGLTDIRLPDRLRSIGERAFSGCAGLKEIVLPDSLETIGDRAFQGCTGLEEIVIPEAVEKIGNEAFYGCTRLKHVTFPDSKVSIGVDVFFGCDSLDQETRDWLEELLSGV